MENNELIYNLSQTLEYTKAGDFEETASITLLPPTFETMDHELKLGQAFVRAAMSASQNTPKQAEQEDTGNASIDSNAVRVILLSSDQDVKAIVDTFIDVCSKVAYLDDEKKIRMKQDHFKKLATADIMSMMCEYIAAFIAPSALPQG